MENIELTILMPCLNEAETLAACIQKAKTFLHQEKIHGEILIADNGSSDGSQKIAEENGARVVHVITRGYGAALLDGIQHASGRFIIMGDADGSYDFLHLMPFLNKLRQGYDLVMGNRFRGGIEPGAMPFLNKYVGNPILSFIGRIFFKTPVHDFHCGLRGFNRESIQKLEMQTNGMEFASEMVAKASLQKLKMTEIPTTLSPDGRSRQPHLRPWRDGWRHLRLLLLLSPRWLFFYPGFLLISSGIILMSFLVSGPITISRTVFDIHTLLFSSLFIIVGLQALLFFIFARMAIASRISHRATTFFLQQFTLERGLMLGGILMLIGFSGSIYAFFSWMHHSFGPLMPTTEMRVLIPAFTFLITGLQIIFASFFMSILTFINQNHLS